MKKIPRVLFVVTICILLIPILTSCGSSPRSLIVGTWNSDWGETWEFREGGSLRVSEGLESITGSYSISSNNELTIINIPVVNDEVIFTWAEDEYDVGSQEWFIKENYLFFWGERLRRW